MNASTWRACKTALLVGVLPIVGFVAWYQNWKPTLALTASIISWFVWAASTIQVRHETFFFWWERVKRLVLNSTSRWRFAARFAVVESEQLDTLLDRVMCRVLESSDARLLNRSEYSADILVAAIAMRVRVVETPAQLHDDEDVVELVLEIPDARTPYRHLRGFFEHILDPLLEDIRKLTGSTSEKYELAFGFPEGTNPYFGMFVRRLQPRGDFVWDYKTKTARNGTVAISRDSLKVVTPNAAELRGYFKRLVGLSAEAAHPR